MTDTFHTLAEAGMGEFRDRGSKFIAYAFPLLSDTDWQEHLEQVRREHAKARHHCYAYRLGLDQNNYRANDDGEPSGTAGRPILGQIDSAGLTNVLVVVVRYFGGTLLGTSGLINAYKASTADALARCEVVERVVEDSYCIRFDYALMSQVMNAVKRLGLRVLQQDFNDTATVTVAIRQRDVEEKLLHLRAYIAEVHLEEVPDMGEIPGCAIEQVMGGTAPS